ncbi:MAG: cation:proton antiporter [Nitrospirae bacterium]|nr:cation:proton antiporter [Nitrospirota bacterium]
METGHHEILQFLLFTGLLILLAKAGGGFSVRLGQSAVLGELTVGLLLGPSFLNFMRWPLFDGAHLDVVLTYFANLGVILLMFIAGLETNLDEMRKMKNISLTAGSLGALTPLLLGFPLAWAFGFSPTASFFIGIILAATSASITVQTLIEINRLDSREGTALLGSAIVDDVLAILILSIFSAVAVSEGGFASIGEAILRMILYFALAGGLGLLLMRNGIPIIQRLPVSEPVLAFTLIMALFYAWSAESIGKVAGITGAYIAGVLMTRTHLLHVVEKKIKPFTYALFVPAFFISIGIQTDLRLLEGRDLPFAALLTLTAIFSKVIGCGGGAHLAGMSRVEALRVGIGMISRGEVGLIVAGIGIQTGLISDSVFAVAVLMVVVTTLITPVLIRWSFTLGDQPSNDRPVFTKGETR